MKKVFLVILILIFVSGCVETTKITGNGLVIENFQTDFDTILPGEPIQFQLRLHNEGTVNALIKNIEILGIEAGNREWREVKNTCKNLINKVVMPNSRKSCVWEFKSPTKNEGLEISYKPKIRVSYKYTTRTLTSVVIGTPSELRKMESRGKTIPIKSSTTGGPITISIKPASPVKVSGDSVTFPVKITLKNNAGGTVCGDENCGNKNWNHITININTDMKLNDCKSQESIELYKGQSNTIVCSLTAPVVKSGIEEKLIEVSSDYGYIIEKSTSFSMVRKNVS